MLKANKLPEREKWDFESFVLSRMSFWNIAKDIGRSKNDIKKQYLKLSMVKIKIVGRFDTQR